MQTERNPFQGMKKFFIAYFALLMLVLTFIGIMGWLGYEMVDASLKYMLFGLLIGSAMIAGALALVRRIGRKWLKFLAGVVLTGIVLAVIALMYVAFSLVLVAVTPLHYTTLTSPEGEAVVIMRQISGDEVMLAQRMEAAGKDAAQGPESEEDLGYLYSVHPRKWYFFYNKNESGEGSVEIGCASGAQLMYEWMGDASLHLYVDAPQSGDGGEIYYRAD